MKRTSMWLLAAVVAMITMGLSAWTALGGPSINVADPGVELDYIPAPPPPLLMPPEKVQDEGLVETSPTDAARSLNRQIVHLPTLEERGDRTAVKVFPLGAPESPGSVEYRILSMVRYSGSDHKTVITLALPSPEAREERTLYGNRAAILTSGERVWLTERSEGLYPNSLVMIRGQHIVTIASDMSVDDLLELASDATMTD